MMNALPFEPKPFKQAIIFIGIQASGKSSFYENLLSCHSYTHINLDTLHTRNKEHKEICNCYDKTLSFVIDNTNPEKNDRARYIPEAKSHGYEVIGFFFQSILKDCIARDGMRERHVPSHAISCTQNKLQMPEYSEGFDKIYFVRITDKGFEITYWIE